MPYADSKDQMRHRGYTTSGQRRPDNQIILRICRQRRPDQTEFLRLSRNIASNYMYLRGDVTLTGGGGGGRGRYPCQNCFCLTSEKGCNQKGIYLLSLGANAFLSEDPFSERGRCTGNQTGNHKKMSPLADEQTNQPSLSSPLKYASIL